jgi:hypothetical protein
MPMITNAELKVIADRYANLIDSEDRDLYEEAQSIYVDEVSNVCVVLGLFDEVSQLREDRDSQQRTCIRVIEDRDRLSAEIVGALTDAGIAMLGEGATASGEVEAAIRRLAAQRDSFKAVEQGRAEVNYKQASLIRELRVQLREILSIGDEMGWPEKTSFDFSGARELLEHDSYDFSGLKDRKGYQRLFEVVIDTERGCDITEGEYDVRISQMFNNSWFGEDDYGLIRDAIAEEIESLNLPEEGCTSVIVYESGEGQDVYWTKFYRVVPMSAVLRSGGADV